MARTYADLFPCLGRPGRVRVCGRMVLEPPRALAALEKARPLREFSQKERPHAPYRLRVGGHEVAGVADDEGWFAHELADLALPGGAHPLEVLDEDGAVCGATVATVLADPGPVVVTSDVDLTYLLDDITTLRGKVGALIRDARGRAAVPGLAELYRTLSRRHALVFLSASPRFFKRTLEAVFERDGLRVAALHLKDVKSLLREGRLGELTHQVGYKLGRLLSQRALLPAGAREVLIGDDSEADAAIYATYRDWLTGRLTDAGALAARLAELGIARPEPLLGAADAVRPHVSPGAVALVAIRRSGSPGERFPAETWVDPSEVFDGADGLASSLADAGL